MAESNHNMDIPSTPSDDAGCFPTSTTWEQDLTMQTSSSGNKTVFSVSAASVVNDHGKDSKDGKSTRDKANTSNPKVNRGCAPLTANHTSADCVQISLGPQYHIFHWGSIYWGIQRYEPKWPESNHNTDIPSTPSDYAGCFPASSSWQQDLTMQTSTSGNKTVFSESTASVVNDHGIVNLSIHALSTTEKLLLSKGLSFCPSPGECNLSNAKIALDKLHRSLCLAHFCNENDALSESSNDEGFSHRNFHPHSTWTPLGNPPPTLTSFIIANNTALSNLPSIKSDFYNLSPLECTAL